MNHRSLLGIALVLSTCFAQSVAAYNVGLLIVATGKYTSFVAPLIKSAEQYFLTDHQVTFFIFTNYPEQIIKQKNVIPLYQDQLPWPFITMMRCSMYCKHQEAFSSMDYLYALDADMRFVNPVGDEILSDLVATQHPGFITDRRGTYETNPASTAYIGEAEGTYYFAGGFYGGKREPFIAMNETMYANIQRDLDNNLIAIWHDESHLNHYFLHNSPTLILSPSYCYAEGSGIPFFPRLVALNKNHAEMRSN